MKYLQTILIVSVGAILASGNDLESSTGVELRLIKTSKEGEPRWMNEDQIWDTLIRNNVHFVDVTDHQDVLGAAEPNVAVQEYPTVLRNQVVAQTLFSQINEKRLQSFVEHFSSFHTRYYTSSTGLKSQKWLLSQVKKSLEGCEAEAASVVEFSHNWPQSSIIAKIEGSDPTLKSEVLVLGAHLDSINHNNASQRAPGADDNAAGSVVVLESLRAIVESGFVPKRTVEFHFYAAEEVGLRGSADVAQSYKNNGVNVVGMLNFDLSGYQEGLKKIGIYTDNTNPQLSQFLRLLVDEYLDYGRQDCKCGYGCSDHASWTGYGYPAAMPAEIKINPHMHTAGDSIDKVTFEQVKEYVKLSLSTVAEFG